MNFLENIKDLRLKGAISEEIHTNLKQFYQSYSAAVKENQWRIEDCTPVLLMFLNYVAEQLHSPFPFPYYHRKLRNYYQFGLDFLRPIIKFEQSRVIGLKNVDTINTSITKGENVILLANHQTEVDPQAISLLLEQTHPSLAHEMIFVAGHRVVTDPLAIPFSLGCHLICIYSKNYIEHPPEKKPEKIAHNRQAMKKLLELLSEGGKCVYVAPSGGRDRPDEKGQVELAPFDPKSVEMFRYMGQHAKQKTRFFPLALSTFPLLPPPTSRSTNMGEPRLVQCSPIHLAFGEELDLNHFPGQDHPDKKERQRLRAESIMSIIKNLYIKIR